MSIFLFACASGDKIEYELNLPEEFYVEIEVTQSSKHGEVTTYYALSESKDGWIYMKLGYDREQYVYKPLSEGKYIEYKYDEDKKEYKATMISDALQEQIDNGSVSLESVATSKESVESRKTVLDNYLCPYSTMGSIFTQAEDVTILEKECAAYDGYINAFLTKSQVYYAIDKETGLTMKYENKTKSWFVETTQVNECIKYQTSAIIPSIEE